MKLDEIRKPRQPKGQETIGWSIQPDGSIDITGCLGQATISLRNLGLPQRVPGHFFCKDNFLTSLEGAPAYIGGNIVCGNNRLTNLSGIHKILKRVGGGMFWCNDNPIISHVLGVLLIDGVVELQLASTASPAASNKSHVQVQNIINSHIKSGRDIIACQDELIDAGFPEYAKL